MSEDKKSCFIIQPLTTPEAYIERYNGDVDHFIHVLNCLHKPAVDKADFRPIEPIAQGADLIQAEIIKNLENADLVLCDISCLNPNVFFEMGVRTALNKPICFVMDEHTGKIPFDTGMLNHKEYKSTLHAWELESQIGIISDHIKASYERSGSKNTLWRILGMKAEAQPYERKMGPEGQMEEVLFRLDTLYNKFSNMDRWFKFATLDAYTLSHSRPENVINFLQNYLDEYIVDNYKVRDDGIMQIDLIGPPNELLSRRLVEEMYDRFKLHCKIRYLTKDGTIPVTKVE